MSDKRTPLQEHIYQLTLACLDVITSGDVVFQDASALADFKLHLPDMVQAIHKAYHVLMAYELSENGEPR